MPAARWPNVKLAPTRACTACNPPTSTSRTKFSAGTSENSFVNASTTRASTPHASISAAFRSTVVSSRGSSPGVSVSRGCRSKVTATLRASRSFAASTVRRNTS